MELSGMLAVARSGSVSSTREPQCGTTTQNQPRVICRDNGACHPHHRELLNIPRMLSTFQSKQNKHQCLSRQNRGPCLNQMVTWFVLPRWKYFGFSAGSLLSRGALTLLRTTGCPKRRCHRGGGGSMGRCSLEAGEDEKNPPCLAALQYLLFSFGRKI